ncbi:hypothetical protein [Streptomyces sp. URMC 129]
MASIRPARAAAALAAVPLGRSATAGASNENVIAGADGALAPVSAG